MAKRPDYADTLRDALLMLALVPLAGVHAARYWLTESLERTSKLATEVIATTAVPRSDASTPSGEVSRATDSVVPDVLAQDLIEAARSFVQSMVRLPADSAICFTRELERSLTVLLEKIQPDAATDLEGHVDRELERLLGELDRLVLVVRSEAGRAAAPSVVLDGKTRQKQKALARKINDLRAHTKTLRDELTPKPTGPVSLPGPPGGPPPALNLYKARIKLEDALREATALLPRDLEALTKIRKAIGDLRSKPGS
jgi:hypothetical protein